MPRVTTYNHKAHAALVAARRVGATLKEACAAHGVPSIMVDNWIQRGSSWNGGDNTN